MQFWLFRVSLSPADPQSLFQRPLGPGERFQLLKSAITAHPVANYRNVDYGLFNVEDENGAIWGRISHRDQVERTVPDTGAPEKLVDILEESNAWTHFVFFGLGEHVFLVQRKQGFFSGSADGMAEIVKKIFDSGLNDNTLEVSVYPLSKQGNFWEAIGECASIYRVDFEFVAPNMFGGRQELAPLLEVQRTLHNANKFKAGIESESGQLRYPRTPQTESEVEYVESGGGKWEIDGRDAAGEKVVVKSNRESVVTVDIADDDQTRVTIRHRVVQILQRVSRFL